VKFIPDLKVGPFDDSETLWTELRARKHRLIDLETIDELFRYDGTRIAIVQASDGQIFLEVVVDEGYRPAGDGPVGIENITHYLPFQDQALIRATMNHDFVPTEATYAAAGPVVRVVLSHIHEAGRNHTIGYSSETVDIGSIDEGEMPYAHLRPGRLSVYGPFEDPFVAEATKEMETSLLHGPDDEVIGFFDCARAWIVRRPNHFNAVSLVACVADDPEGYVQHRLHFDDEKAMLDSLATFAPTMETYRIAKSMRREVIGPSTPRGTWVTIEDFKVEDLADDDMRIERPAFDTPAEHDAKWPDFARKPDGEGTGGDAPEGEGN
jgi:hypothetical protein